MAETQGNVHKDIASDTTDELMELLIRDPDSLCKDDLERLCEAISRDALSTKNAIANGECLRGTTNFDDGNPRILSPTEPPTDPDSIVPVPWDEDQGTQQVKVLQNKPAGPTVINMASGDGLQQISYQNRFVGDAVLAVQSSPSGNIGTSAPELTDSRNQQRRVEDTASNRVFSTLVKSGSQLGKITNASSTQTIRSYPIATITGTKGFLVRSANGVTMTCPFERAYQVGQPSATFYAMPARQMKYTVPCSEQAIATTNWLLKNFEENILSTMPRSAMYQAYVGCFGASEKIKHFNQAVFGKMVRACFPNLTTRRLGVRGHSRYHYSGLAVKPTSMYANVLSNRIEPVPRLRCPTKKTSRLNLGVAANVTIDSNATSNEMVESNINCPDHCESADLPSYYPGIQELMDHPKDIEFESWKLFVTFYSDYNSQLFTFMSSLDHEKTRIHMQKFEVLLPDECVDLLQNPFVQDVICVFDGILFKQATTSLLPHCMVTLSTEFKVSLRKFARAFVEWTSTTTSSHKIPQEVLEIRSKGATVWADYIKRVTTLCHVAKEARKSLKDNAVTKQLRIDLEGIALEEISFLSSWCEGGGDALQAGPDKEVAAAMSYMNAILTLLKGRARLDEYVCVVDKIVKEQLLQCRRNRCAEKQFLMKWSMYSSKILTEITLKSSASVGIFHLLSLLFGDYVNHLIRFKHETDKLRGVAAGVLKDLPNHN